MMPEIFIWIGALALVYLLVCAVYAVCRLFVILVQSTLWLVRNRKRNKRRGNSDGFQVNG